MGYLRIEQERYESAAAHLMVSLVFEDSPLSLSEIMYMKMQHGQDFTDMTPTDAFDVLKAAGEPVVIDRATREALVRLVHRSLKDDDYQTALHAAIELYKIMRDEDYRDIARKVAKKMGISLDLR